MNFNLVVIGSGLSALSFIDSYLENNTEIDVISPEFQDVLDAQKTNNSHLFVNKNLPPQMQDNLTKIKNYFTYNNFNVNKNANVMGSLEFGGLSNYWGFQMDRDILGDAKILSKKNKRKLQEAFFELAEKLEILGKFNVNKKSFSNDFEVDNFFENLIKQKKIEKLDIIKPLLAISALKKNDKKINLNKINEEDSKVNAKNYYRKFLKDKNIRFHNYAITKIFLEKDRVKLVGQNKNNEKIFYSKKVVFACGTLVTTKLILESLKIKQEIKVKEHPRLLSVFFSKKKIQNYLEFMPSQMQIRSDKGARSFLVDFRPGNKFIIDTALQIYKFLLPFKFLLYYLRNNMIFSNILLDSKYSNIFMKMEKNSKTLIYSKNKNNYRILKKVHKEILKLLQNKNLIYPISKNIFPGHGSAYHYFGTIPITKKNKQLSVNDKCQLKNFKNVYVVDGSVFDFKINKYPLGIIMANARRVAKEIK